MKIFYQIAAAIFLAAFLLCCSENTAGKHQEKTVAFTASTTKEIEVTLIGTVRTRRTFAGIQFIDNEKEQNRYIAEQEKSNPTVSGIFSAADSMLVKQFERLRLIKNDELLLAKFTMQTKRQTDFIDSAKRVFRIQFFQDSLKGNIHFKIFFSKDTIDIDTEAAALQDLDYTFLDVIPGGNKELIFLDDYYIMNGYNFDYKVYSIKSN